MVDFKLTERQLLLQRTARDFAENEIKPIVKEIEKMDRTKFTPWDKCRDMVKKATKLGFTTLLIPEKYGGGGGGCMDNVILDEELAVADIGIAATFFSLSTCVPVIIVMAGTEKQRERWLREVCSADQHVFGIALTEADTPGSEVFCPYPDPKLGIKTYAKREGDMFVINGSKSAFITNTGAAKAFLLVARTDLTKPGFESMSIFYLPTDTPGFTTGKLTELIGWRTAQNGELFLDNVRIPKENLVGKEGDALNITLKALPYIAIGLASCYVGLARAIYEYALDYAKRRVSWGQPIIQHQAIALKLADMLVNTQAARLVVWEGAYAADTGSELAATIKSPSAKTFAVDVAIENAQNAVKILGGYGVTKEFQTEKYLCDAWVGYSCDFTRDMLRLGIANFL